MSKIFTQNNNTLKTIYYFFIDCISTYKVYIIGQLLVSVLWSLHVCFRPYLIKVMIDNMDLSQSLTENTVFLYAFIIFVCISLIAVLLTIFNDYIWMILNSELKKTIAIKVYNRLVLHSKTYFQDNFAGSLGSKVNDVMNAIPDILKLIIEKLLGYIIVLTLGIYILSRVNQYFAIFFSIWILMYIAITVYFVFKSRNLCEKTSQYRSKVIGYLVDILSNVLSIKLFNAIQWEKAILSRNLNTYNNAYQQRGIFFIKLVLYQGISYILYLTCCFLAIIYFFYNKNLSQGDFALLITLNISVIELLKQLSIDINTTIELFANLIQGYNTIYSTPEILDSKNAKELIIKNGKIEFKKVCFQHSSSNFKFTSLSLTFNPKQKIGLVGFTGSGKTTFVNLLLRQFNLYRGQILIDGNDISKVTYNSLMKHVSFVPQDISMFHRSVFDNIKYGNNNATDEEVISASKLAHVDEFVKHLPDNYNTIVGERGVKLSGGQRQRIAIARAILKNSPILIMDEATSNLDNITEKLIQQSLTNLWKNKTVIVIAHRLTTLLKMDRIVIFDNGKIVGDGTHTELKQISEVYRKLWDSHIDGVIM